MWHLKALFNILYKYEYIAYICSFIKHLFGLNESLLFTFQKIIIISFI